MRYVYKYYVQFPTFYSETDMSSFVSKKHNVENVLTLATTLNTHIGYDKATKMTHYAFDKNISLKEANDQLKFVPEDKLSVCLDPRRMV